MSVSSIQGLTTSSYVTEQSKRKKKQQYEEVFSRNIGPDTVSLSEEAFALIKKYQSASAERNSTENEKKLLELKDKDASDSTDTASSLPKKDMFSALLESLVIDDLEKNGSFSSKTSEAVSKTEAKNLAPVTPEKQTKTASIKGDKGTKSILKTLTKLAKGKATFSDILTAISTSGKKTTSPMESVISSKDEKSKPNDA